MTYPAVDHVVCCGKNKPKVVALRQRFNLNRDYFVSVGARYQRADTRTRFSLCLP